MIIKPILGPTCPVETLTAPYDNVIANVLTRSSGPAIRNMYVMLVFIISQNMSCVAVAKSGMVVQYPYPDQLEPTCYVCVCTVCCVCKKLHDSQKYRSNQISVHVV